MDGIYKLLEITLEVVLGALNCNHRLLAIVHTATARLKAQEESLCGRRR